MKIKLIKLAVLITAAFGWIATAMWAVLFLLDSNSNNDGRLGIYLAVFLGGMSAVLWVSSELEDRWPS
jgi:hypothetical protein